MTHQECGSIVLDAINAHTAGAAFFGAAAAVIAWNVLGLVAGLAGDWFTGRLERRP